MRRHHRWSLLPALVLLPALGACAGPDGVASALEEDGFASCVADADVAAPADDDRTPEEQLAFWAEPGTLECAVAELDDDARSDVLDGAFGDAAADDAADAGDLRAQQWQALGDWAARTATDQGVDEAVAQAETLLAGIEVDDGGDGDAVLRGYAGAVVSSALRATQGLESYEVDAADRPAAEDTVDRQVAFLAEGPGQGPGRPATDEWRRYEDLREDLVTRLRGD